MYISALSIADLFRCFARITNPISRNSLGTRIFIKLASHAEEMARDTIVIERVVIAQHAHHTCLDFMSSMHVITIISVSCMLQPARDVVIVAVSVIYPSGKSAKLNK